MKIRSAALSLITAVTILAGASGNISASGEAALTVTNIDSSANRLSWESVPGAKAYVIYSCDEQTGSLTKLGEVSGTSCRDTALTPGTKYTYRVRAKFPDGTLGDISAPAEIFTYNNIGRMPCNFFGAAQGDRIYYSSGYYGFRGDEGYTVSTVNMDGTGYRKLSGDYGAYVNVMGDYIYYLDCGSECIKRIKTDGTGEQILLTAQDYAPWEITAAGDMIYYLLTDKVHEEVPGFCELWGMKTDGSGNKYICNMGEEVNPRYIGTYGGFICFGFEEFRVISDDDEYGGYHAQSTGRYIVKGVSVYECREICSLDHLPSGYPVTNDEGLFYAGEEGIIRYDIASGETETVQKLPAYHFNITGDGIAYTEFSGTRKTIHIYSEGKDRTYCPEGVASFSFFDGCVFVLEDSGRVKIIPY